MRKFNAYASRIAIVAAAVSGLASTAYAQKPGAADEAPAGMEEIVVTAQKAARAESVQKVPISVTALSGDALRSKQLTSAYDFGRVAPGVRLGISNQPLLANFVIRGIGFAGSIRNIDPTVSTVIDGQVQEFIVGTMVDSFDVSSVEVLRGPQGILFGRNATGGAISYTSRRPTNELQIDAEARYGSGNRMDFSLFVAGPIVEDKILAKIAILRRKADGLFHDRNEGTFVPAPNNPSGVDSSGRFDVGGEDVWSIRPTVVVKPTDNLTLSLIGEYTDQEGSPGAGVRSREVVPNLQTLFGYTRSPGKYDTNTVNEPVMNFTQKRLVSEINWETEVGVLTSVSGYRHVKYKAIYDVASTPFPLYSQSQFDKSTQYSQETRFASTFSEVVDFTVGGYYSKLSINSEELRQISGYFGGGNVNVQRFQRGIFEQDSKSRAAFYNINVKPFAGLTLSHGGRYTKDTKEIAIVPISLCAGLNYVGCPNTYTNRKASWDDFSPRFVAQYQLARSTMVYASWSKGWRSGNFNSRATSIPAIGPAQPETVRSTEVGIKSTFLNGRARVNLSLFSTDYKNIQRTVLVGNIQTLANAASAKVKGLELETTLIPIPGLTLVGNLGYTDAKFNEYLNLDVNGGGYDPLVDPLLAKKLKFDNVPRWTGYTSATYEHSVGDWGKVSASVNYSYQSSYFSEALNQVPLGRVGLLGASLGVEHSNWKLTVYARNLTNKEYGDQGSIFIYGPVATGGRSTTIWGGEPRNYGVSLRFTL